MEMKKYAVLLNYKSANSGIGNNGIIYSFFTFDDKEDAAELLSQASGGRGGIFALLERDELLFDNYDDVVLYLYNPILVIGNFGGNREVVSTVKGVQVVQTCRILPNEDEIPEGEPIFFDADGEERTDLWELFFPNEPKEKNRYRCMNFRI